MQADPAPPSTSYPRRGFRQPRLAAALWLSGRSPRGQSYPTAAVISFAQGPEQPELNCDKRDHRHEDERDGELHQRVTSLAECSTVRHLSSIHIR
jgi:hypothetical protein